MARNLPDELWIGTTDEEWPVIAFTEKTMARDWLKTPHERRSRTKRLWRLTNFTAREMTLTEPVEQELIEK